MHHDKHEFKGLSSKKKQSFKREKQKQNKVGNDSSYWLIL